MAGIIAARPVKGTGFVGLAPDATIIPIKQNNAEGDGTAETLADAIKYAVQARRRASSTSPGHGRAARPQDSTLKNAIDYALGRKVVVVASAGNDGLGGNVKETYPAAYRGRPGGGGLRPQQRTGGVLTVGRFRGRRGARRRHDLSTVPGNGHCSDNGTSFSTPYVAGVAALLKSKYPDWTAREVAAQIEQTAEHSIPGHDETRGVGRGRPVKAVTDVDPAHPVQSPHPANGVAKGEPRRSRPCTSAKRPRNATAGWPPTRSWAAWSWWRA
ncbi:S8 family serine peptidase [Streptomyces tricolor]|nr:S8 family serine peptidase [Streptomyces tricolor]